MITPRSTPIIATYDAQLSQQLAEVQAEIVQLRMPTVRCACCGLTLYCGPNGVEPGDHCGASIPAEYLLDGSVRTTCPGIMEATNGAL